VNLLTGPERFIVLTWSSKRKTTGRWSESRISEMMTSDSRTFLCTTISSTSPFPAGEWVRHRGAEIQTHFSAINSVVLRLEGWKPHYSKLDI
jgi:hypothetical protein